MLDALCNFVSGVQKFEISYIRCQCHSKLSQNNFKSDDKFGQQFDIRIFFCKKKNLWCNIHAKLRNFFRITNKVTM